MYSRRTRLAEEYKKILEDEKKGAVADFKTLTGLLSEYDYNLEMAEVEIKKLKELIVKKELARYNMD
ncbi:MAG: hypothetical protein IJN64_10890 [Lachnospiraceae bacterium]|nr:hypothetical protein [Lachnospiraceae bacterium]